MGCDLCGVALEDTEAKGFELHELSPDKWAVVCIPCVLTLELNEGK